MGSVGSGSFGDYKPSQQDDMCLNAIKSVVLEEVARSPYFLEEKEVPGFMDEVQVLEGLHNRRIAVISVSKGLIIGYLPTRYNYLLSCMKKGIRYLGKVDSSLNQTIPKVTVTIHAEQ